MVSGLAYLSVAISTIFMQSMLVRYTRARKPHEFVWTIALAMFALASIALALGTSTGWDKGTFRVFFLFGAILNVPWLALGTVYLVTGPTIGRRVQWGLVLFSGLAAGVLLTAPIKGSINGSAIPIGKDVFGVFPRVLAGVGSGVGAIVIFGGALWSIVKLRNRPDAQRRAVSNGLIAFGTLVLSAGGLTQGIVGKDDSFAISLAIGIAIIYCGFIVSTARKRQPLKEQAEPSELITA